MFKFGLNELYENYRDCDVDRDTKLAQEIFNEIFGEVVKTLSSEMQNNLLDLVLRYAREVEERSFKDGFRSAVHLIKECGL